MNAIYNEIDPFAVRWLRNLIAAGHIAPGVVNDRSIKDLRPDDVTGSGQRHFFAGIAGWSHALRLAGVPDDADVWTGSCPCQSLSDAGKRKGFDDARHLWPDWFRLIRECRPAVVFGEQVASGLGWAWLDLVFADLEGAGYACAAANLPAAGVGAPHRRQRLLFVAYADEVRQQRAGLARFGFAGPAHRCDCGHLFDSHEWHSEGPQECGECSCTYFVFGRRIAANADQPGQQGRILDRDGADKWPARAHGLDGNVAHPEAAGRRAGRLDRAHGRQEIESDGYGATRQLGDSSGTRTGRDAGAVPGTKAQGDCERSGDGRVADSSIVAGADFWSPCERIPCSDGVSRPTEPGTHPLAHGVPGRVGLLRGYGNAIVPQVAAAFIRAALEAA